MPSSPGYKRNLKEEYATQVKRGDSGTGSDSKNAIRHRDRTKALKLGLVKPSDDLDHKKPLSKGGGSSPSNFRDETAAVNRSFPRNPDGSMIANHPKAK